MSTNQPTTPDPTLSPSGMIYLATPYSHPDPSVMEQRFHIACRVAARLMAEGRLIFSPIAHTHPIAVSGDLPKGWDFWQKYDHAMLDAAAELWVVRMDGWDKSKGIAGEIAYMQAAGKPVVYIDPTAEDSTPPAPALPGDAGAWIEQIMRRIDASRYDDGNGYRGPIVDALVAREHQHASALATVTAERDAAMQRADFWKTSNDAHVTVLLGLEKIIGGGEPELAAQKLVADNAALLERLRTNPHDWGCAYVKRDTSKDTTSNTAEVVEKLCDCGLHALRTKPHPGASLAAAWSRIAAAVGADPARYDEVAERVERMRAALEQAWSAIDESIKVVDDCYEATGHIRVAKASQQRTRLERAVIAAAAALSPAPTPQPPASGAASGDAEALAVGRAVLQIPGFIDKEEGYGGADLSYSNHSDKWTVAVFGYAKNGSGEDKRLDVAIDAALSAASQSGGAR